jgi:hypothetical protein
MPLSPIRVHNYNCVIVTSMTMLTMLPMLMTMKVMFLLMTSLMIEVELPLMMPRRQPSTLRAVDLSIGLQPTRSPSHHHPSDSVLKRYSGDRVTVLVTYIMRDRTQKKETWLSGRG